MVKSVKGVIIALLVLLAPFLSLAATNASSGVYYIYTDSPKYTILPGSIYVESVPQSCPIEIAVLLNFTNYQYLELLTQLISNHQEAYLAPSQFRSMFYPSETYKQELIQYLESYGLQLTGDYGLILTFTGTVGEFEEAFNTYINVYYYPYQNLYWFGVLGMPNVGEFYYFANNVTPSLPYSVGQYVAGIVYVIPVHYAVANHQVETLSQHVYPVMKAAWTLATQKAQGGGHFGNLISPVLVTPSAIAQYFGFTKLYQAGFLGQGTTIAIEGEPECYVNPSDIYTFWEKFAIVPRTGSLHVIYFGFTFSGPSFENELDAEWSGILAPAANIYIVFSDGYVGGPALVGNLLNYYYEYYYMVNYLDPNVISIGVTVAESYLAAYYPAMLWMIHNLMMQAVDEGISVLAASGDWGYETDYHPPNFNIGIYNTIWYPESDPYVTSVGGIFVNATSTGQVYSISGWDYSTGGHSLVFPVQNFELTSVIPNTPTYARTYPDIAFVAAGGYDIPEYGYGLPMTFLGQLFVWYGTSGAAPMTAAMVALTGLRLGDLNTILYHISYSGAIKTPTGEVIGLPAWIPITSGYNGMPAQYGWNYVTGPGTYNAYNMVYDLRLYYFHTYGANKVNQFASAIEFNGKNQYFVTRDFNITISGKSTSVGLFSYVALKYHAETIAVLVYLTPNTDGAILGLSANTPPFNIPPYGWTPLVYVSGGKLIIAEWNPAGSGYSLSQQGEGYMLPPPVPGQGEMAFDVTKPGLYWIVVEERTNSTSTLLTGYVNGTLIDVFYSPVPNGSSLFGQYGPYQYNFVGISYTEYWPLTNGNWYPFNGSVVSLIVYPFPLSQSQIDQLVNGNIPSGYFALFEASSNYYHNGVWYAVNNQSIYMTAVNNPQLVQLG